jgi:hypothetical protein
MSEKFLTVADETGRAWVQLGKLEKLQLHTLLCVKRGRARAIRWVLNGKSPCKWEDLLELWLWLSPCTQIWLPRLHENDACAYFGVTSPETKTKSCSPRPIKAVRDVIAALPKSKRQKWQSELAGIERTFEVIEEWYRNGCMGPYPYRKLLAAEIWLSELRNELLAEGGPTLANGELAEHLVALADKLN